MKPASEKIETCLIGVERRFAAWMGVAESQIVDPSAAHYYCIGNLWQQAPSRLAKTLLRSESRPWQMITLPFVRLEA